jgi:hypothetical protein
MRIQKQFATEITEKYGGADQKFSEQESSPGFLCVLCDLCGLS